MVRARVERVRTDALLVRRVPVGESDLIVTLFTEARGVVSASARSARKSWKRFASLEPMHLLRVSLEERPGAEVMSLSEAGIARARPGLVADLRKLEAAGQALRWVRRAAPPLTPEPGAWEEVNRLLDTLDREGADVSAGAGVSAGASADEGISAGTGADAGMSAGTGAASSEGRASPEAHLAGAGLRLLAAIGWGLDLERCVRCGRPCEGAAAACVDPAAGGLVCRACGGANQIVRGDRRVRMLAAMAGEDSALASEDAKQVLELVEAALAAHSGQTQS